MPRALREQSSRKLLQFELRMSDSASACHPGVYGFDAEVSVGNGSAPRDRPRLNRQANDWHGALAAGGDCRLLLLHARPATDQGLFAALDNLLRTRWLFPKFCARTARTLAKQAGLALLLGDGGEIRRAQLRDGCLIEKGALSDKRLIVRAGLGNIRFQQRALLGYLGQIVRASLGNVRF